MRLELIFKEKVKKGMAFDETVLAVAQSLKMQWDFENTTSPITLIDCMIGHLEPKHFMNLITKLVEKYKAIKFTQPWHKIGEGDNIFLALPLGTAYICKVEPTENFDAFCKNGLTPCVDSNAKIKLIHTKSGEVLVHGTFLLCVTNHNSINHRLLSFLTRNPNKTFSREDLIKKGVLKPHEDKDFHTIVSDLGFSGDLKKLFFEVTIHSIRLKNPIFPKDLDDANMRYPNIKGLIKGKKNHSE